MTVNRFVIVGGHSHLIKTATAVEVAKTKIMQNIENTKLQIK